MPQIKTYKTSLINDNVLYFVYKFSVDGKESPAVMVTTDELTDSQVEEKILAHIKDPQSTKSMTPKPSTL